MESENKRKELTEEEIKKIVGGNNNSFRCPCGRELTLDNHMEIESGHLYIYCSCGRRNAAD